MSNKFKNLTVIVPTTRGIKSIPTIKSALSQIDFDEIIVIITGKSTRDEMFKTAINKELNNCNFHIVECKNKDVVLPGEARNDGLRYIKQKKLNSEFVFFLDDDVIVPEEYCLILANFMHNIGSCASMGRISSVPMNFWTIVIDYSNFWWAQVRENVNTMKWLATTATLTKIEYIDSILFEENIAVNEDVIFFDAMSKKTNKSLSICAEITGEHHHTRKNFKEFFKYQFNNGKKGVLFLGNGLNLINIILSVKQNFQSSFAVNNKFLKNNKKIAFGILVSFIIFQIGIEYGSFVAFLSRIKKYFDTAIQGRLRQPVRKVYYLIKLKKIK